MKDQADAAKRQAEFMERQVTQMIEQNNEAKDQAVMLATQSARQLQEMAEQRHVAQIQAEELIHQTRLSIAPAFTAEIGDQFPGFGAFIHPRLLLTNVGNGPAINIDIDPVEVPTLHLKPEQVALQPNIVFLRTVLIKQGESVCLEPYSRNGEEPAPQPTYYLRSVWFNPEEHAAKVRLRFLDIEGNSYVQEMILFNKGCKIGPAKLQKG